MKRSAAKINPANTTRRTIRALGGRHVVIKAFSGRAFVSIAGGSDVPVGAWLSAGELRHFVEAAQRILK